MIERLQNEAGYSLVEVIASIMILTIAIIPMVGMFDAGLRAAATSGDYDKARASANQKLEEAKSLPYADVKDDFPAGGCAPTDSREKNCSNLTTGLPQGLTSYSVAKQFLNEELMPPSDGKDEGMMKVTVTVYWGDNSYTTTGVVGR